MTENYKELLQRLEAVKQQGYKIGLPKLPSLAQAKKMVSTDGVPGYLDLLKRPTKNDSTNPSDTTENITKAKKFKRVSKEQKALILKIIKVGGFTSPQHIKASFKHMFELAAILGYGKDLPNNTEQDDARVVDLVVQKFERIFYDEFGSRIVQQAGSPKADDHIKQLLSNYKFCEAKFLRNQNLDVAYSKDTDRNKNLAVN